MDDLALESRALRMKTQTSLLFPKILGDRALGHPFTYDVRMHALNGSATPIYRGKDRSRALKAQSMNKKSWVIMYDALTGEKVAETGRAQTAFLVALMAIKAEFNAHAATLIQHAHAEDGRLYEFDDFAADDTLMTLDRQYREFWVNVHLPSAEGYVPSLFDPEVDEYHAF